MQNKDFLKYRELLCRLEAFAAVVLKTHRDDIACAAGCCDCCSQVLELLPVEFLYLEAAARQSGLTRPAKAGPGCPLLSGGRCLLYDYRPVICRTHGLPLLIEEEGRRRVDCCPKNFRRAGLAAVPGGSLLDLERVNLLLVSVNHVFARARGLDPLGRRSIADLFQPGEGAQTTKPPR
jgi:hypothetical protein